MTAAHVYAHSCYTTNTNKTGTHASLLLLNVTRGDSHILKLLKRPTVYVYIYTRTYIIIYARICYAESTCVIQHPVETAVHVSTLREIREK